MPYGDADLARQVSEGSRDTSDRRSHFQHDRDRILYSSAFRRLAGKTQVVGAAEFGLYHTRLTHSLKVAQLGRRLAERLRAQYQAANPKLSLEVWPPDPDLVEAACLAHDIGHAPFGHVGEEALAQRYDEIARGSAKITSRAIKAHGGFEGNAQTLRILTYLSAREPIEPRCGLNLTRATLDGSVKYPRFRIHGKVECKKWGAIELDRARLTWIREGGTIGPDAPKSFEAGLMDWCDDVTYAVHDVIDFYRGGAIPLHEFLGGGVPRKGSGFPSVVVDFLRDVGGDPDVKDDYSQREIDDAWLNLLGLTQGVLDEPWGPTLEKKAATQTVTSLLITHLVNEVTWTEGGAPCRHEGEFLIAADENRARQKILETLLLKKLLWKRVIERHPLASQQHGQQRIVSDLLDIYFSDERLLPPDRRQELEDHKDPLRAATDHVASLTEEEAQALYRRLTGTSLGAITDVLT